MFFADEPHCLQKSVKKSQLPASHGKLKRESKDFVADNMKCVASTNQKYNQQKVVDSQKGKACPVNAPRYIFKKVSYTTLILVGQLPNINAPPKLFKNFGIPPVFKKQVNHPATSSPESEQKIGLQNNIHLLSKEDRASIQQVYF